MGFNMIGKLCQLDTGIPVGTGNLPLANVGAGVAARVESGTSVLSGVRVGKGVAVNATLVEVGAGRVARLIVAIGGGTVATVLHAVNPIAQSERVSSVIFLSIRYSRFISSFSK